MHPTQRALLKAVAAAPNDDTPRLVYADWLDEHAPELPNKEREATAARAEMIRVQCELARLSEEDTEARWLYEYLRTHGELYDSGKRAKRVDWSALDPGLARRFELLQRATALRTAHSATWERIEVPRIDGVTYGMCRGFWTNLSLAFPENRKPRDFARAVDAVVAHPDYVPPERLHCDFVLTVEEAKYLTASGLTNHLTAVSDVNWDRPTLFTALGARKAASGIREVWPGSSPVSDLAPFARANWSGLRGLHVHARGDYGVDGLHQLSQAKHLANLESLSINDDLRADLWDLLDVAAGVWKGIRRLSWEAFGMNELKISTLAGGKSLSNLRYLFLGRDLDTKATTLVFETARWKKLIVLELETENLRGLSARSLKASPLTKLRVLHISANTSADLLALAGSPATHNVEILRLGRAVSNASVTAFFRAMQMPKLTMLDLSDCKELGPAAVKALAACDRLTNLQTLDLSRNEIGADGAKHLAASKHLLKLRYLGVSQTGIGEPALRALRKRFGDEVVDG